MIEEQKAVLIVEDDLRMQQSLRGRLQEDGLNVFAANDADQGLAILRREQIDLVLLDLRLGEKSGLDFMDEMKDDERIEDEGITVVVLTAIADPAMIGDVIGRRPADYLVKSDNSLDDISAF